MHKCKYALSGTSIAGGPPKIHGGPFGRGGFDDIPFSLTGDIREIFGQHGDVLDAVGFYMNTSVPFISYKKTDLIGGIGGDNFDDFVILATKNEKPLKITNMIINYGSLSAFINGIQVTYMVSKEATTTATHGTLVPDNSQGHNYFAILDFDADEWITKVDISSRESGPYQVINYLKIETTNPKGSIRSYGPFGQVYLGNITTVESVIHGFYGRSSDYIYGLGFYI